jgi:hypothetical protein
MTTFDTTETTETTEAPVPADAQIPRIDLYRDVHKGVRAELFGVTLQAGSLDPSDRTARLAFADRVGALVRLLETHAAHEDDWIQPVIETYLPSAASRIASDHAAFDTRTADIHEMARAAAQASGEPARTIGHEVYLELASFTSAYLSHQDLEERVVMPTLAANLTPLAVLEINESIVSHIPPAEMAEYLAIMIPAMNVDDRTELLGGMRAGAPAEVFAGIWGLVGSVLTSADLAAVATRLGITV